MRVEGALFHVEERGVNALGGGGDEDDEAAGAIKATEADEGADEREP